MKQKVVPLIATVLTLFVAGCSRPSADSGEIKNGTYHNRFFGMTVQLPADWKIAEHKSIDGATQLFGVSQYDFADQTHGNPNILCWATDLKSLPDVVTTGAEYLSSAKKGMSARFIITQDITTESIDGRPFGVMRLDDKKENTIVHKIFTATTDKGYAIGFSVGYGTDEEGKTIDEVLQSIKFAK